MHTLNNSAGLASYNSVQSVGPVHSATKQATLEVSLRYTPLEFLDHFGRAFAILQHSSPNNTALAAKLERCCFVAAAAAAAAEFQARPLVLVVLLAPHSSEHDRLR